MIALTFPPSDLSVRSGPHADRRRALALPSVAVPRASNTTSTTPLVRSAPTRPPSDRIVIVDVDERSLATVGQWPWRRDVIGRLISSLRDLGAAVWRSTSSLPNRIATREAASTRTQALADTLRGGRVVLGYAMTFDGSHHMARTVCTPSRRSRHRSPPDEQIGEPFFRATGAVCSLPEPDAGGRRLRVSERRPGSGRHSPTRALADGVRRSRLSDPLARPRCDGHRRAGRLRSGSPT